MVQIRPSQSIIEPRKPPIIITDDQAQTQTAQRAGEQADKKRQQVFAVVYLSVRSSFDVEIFRRDESRPRSSIPSAVLARGKTKYRRKRSRQNLVHLPACAVK